MSLHATYIEGIRPKLVEELELKNVMAAPSISKVVVDMGVGEGARNKELVEQLTRDLALMTGQKPQTRAARKAISGFNTREGDLVGIRVTLRRGRMYDFLEKVIKIVLPRLRDFRGISRKAFDGRGSYTLGMLDHTIFPEVEVGKSGRPWGLGITIVTTTKDDRQAMKLLEEIGMPFEKGEER